MTLDASPDVADQAELYQRFLALAQRIDPGSLKTRDWKEWDEAHKVDYHGQHGAPGPEGDAADPMHDIGRNVLPSDFGNTKLYGTGFKEADEESAAAIRKARGNPEATIRVYRALPKGHEKIHGGDWVTPSRKYAEQHAASGWGSDSLEAGHVIAQDVKARELWSDGNSINEWGWHPGTRIDPGALVTRDWAKWNAEHKKWSTTYHLTSNPRFALDPKKIPEDNTTLGMLKDPGLYVDQTPEHWINGHDYVRPFVAELKVPADGSAFDNRGYGDFIPAKNFDQVHVTRVIPLDAHAREEYSSHGWIEQHHGTEFDTGKKIEDPGWDAPVSAHYPFKGYRYSGPDVRNMGTAELQGHKQRWLAYLKANRGFDPERLKELSDEFDAGLPRTRIEAGYLDTRSWAIFDAARPKHPRVKHAVETATEAKQETDPFGWKPTMTPAEADAWLAATGSKVKKPLFHGTQPGNVPRIKRTGFITRPGAKSTSFAQHFGQGAYLTDANGYAFNFSGQNPAGVLETRIAVKNPASSKETHDIVEAVKARKPPVEQIPVLVREEAERRGFDALSVTDYYARRGGRELTPTTNYVVFDPHKVVVVEKPAAKMAA